jgi:hypothetical protein
MVKQVNEAKQEFPDVAEVLENFEYDLNYFLLDVKYMIDSTEEDYQLESRFGDYNEAQHYIEMVSDIHAAVYRLYNEFKQLSDIEE